jgi:hypothetical protein
MNDHDHDPSLPEIGGEELATVEGGFTCFEPPGYPWKPTFPLPTCSEPEPK